MYARNNKQSSQQRVLKTLTERCIVIKIHTSSRNLRLINVQAFVIYSFNSSRFLKIKVIKIRIFRNRILHGLQINFTFSGIVVHIPPLPIH